MNVPITRRAAIRQLGMLAGCATAASAGNAFGAKPDTRTGMGLVIYDCNIRRRWMRKQEPQSDLFEPRTFLKYCQSLGAGGMQARLGVIAKEEARYLREYAEQHGLFIDAIVNPPKDDRDVPRFEAEIKTARDVGVQAVRTTIIPGRRYERFNTLEAFRRFETLGREMLERAAAVVAKYRVSLAVENHKDQRLEERVALFKHLDNEFIGACVDTGNSFALLDGAYEPIEALAPYAFTVHLKDQALRPYEDGFLLGDIPLGQGSFDLKKMVAIIRKAKPNVRFALELITRDPLKVPCLTQSFYATMPDARAIDLARTMEFVRQHPAKSLQYVSSLLNEKQVQLEDANVLASIRYAGSELGL